MSRSITIKTHDFGNIVVGSLRNCQSLCTRSFQQDRDSATSTILDLRSKAELVWNKPQMTQQVYGAMINDQLTSYDYTQTIENFNASAYWIWGDVRSGGVALIHYPQDKISFFVSNGYYTQASNPQRGKFYGHYYFPCDFANNHSDAFKSIFWGYYITSELSTSIINPYPPDTYSQYIMTIPNYRIGNITANTTDVNNPCWWKQLEQEIVESGQIVWTRDFYDPPTPTDWNNRFDASTWTNLSNQGKETLNFLSLNSGKKYAFYYCLCSPDFPWSGSYQSQNILDDDNYQLSGYNHMYGSWHGELVPDPDEDEPNDPQGGGGNKPTWQDPVGPTNPENYTADVLSSGFVRLYKPVTGELRGLANYMFGSITDLDVLHLKKLLANPLDYIIALNMVHFSPQCSTYEEDVKIGGLSVGEGLGMLKLDSQYYRLDGGSVTIERAFGNFHDYAPFTRCQVVVPYCGIHDLPIDIVMNSTIHLNYVVDMLSGSMVAQLTMTKAKTLRGEANAINNGLLQTYTGNCFTPCPLANTDYRGAVNGVLGIAGSAVTSLVSGNPLPLASGVSNAVTNSKPSVSSNISTAGNYGYMGQQKAYIILSRPVQNMASDENNNTITGRWLGYRSNIFRRVEQFEGVLTVKKGTFWMDETQTNATKEEIDEIKELLEGGICI